MEPRPGHGKPDPDGPARPDLKKPDPARPDLAHGPGLGLIFRPDGQAGPGSGLPYLPFNEEARPVARGPSGFLTDGPGLGLKSRPDGWAGPGSGPGFLQRVLFSPARPDIWPGIVSLCEFEQGPTHQSSRRLFTEGVLDTCTAQTFCAHLIF